jgi:hypothetical protein
LISASNAIILLFASEQNLKQNIPIGIIQEIALNFLCGFKGNKKSAKDYKWLRRNKLLFDYL